MKIMSQTGICRQCGARSELSIKGYCQTCFNLNKNPEGYKKSRKRICRICKRLETISAYGACERCYQRIYHRQYRAKQRRLAKWNM